MPSPDVPPTAPLSATFLENWGTVLFHDIPMAVYLRDQDGTFLRVNPAMAQLFGYDAPQAFLEAMATAPEQFYLDEASRAAVQKSLDHDGRLAERQSQALSRDGFVFWIEESATLVDGHGGGRNFFGYLRDITSEKSTKWALAEAEEKYRAIFEHAVEGLFQMTPTGRYVTANCALARMLGHPTPQSLTEAPDGAMTPFVHIEDWQFLVATLSTVGVTRGLEVELKRPDGSRLWTSLYARAVRDGRGRPVLYEGSMEDVTERRRSQEQLRQNLKATKALFHQTVKSLSTTVRFRDSYTATHQDNVSRLAAATARRMGLPETTVDGIEVAGQLHDIGKINVPVRYLCKPGRLTPLEWEFMKQHVQTGYEILRDIAFPWPVAEIVLAHHERLDGSGYPRGISQRHILPEARVLAVADVLDAMASDRPYRPALGLEAALSELTRHKGTHYDPDAVEAIRDVVTGGGFTAGA
jgi:PAS domain S-box-containing protein/putative nucleotidyltransferase with HDIG domain